MKLVMLVTRRRVVVHHSMDGVDTLCGRRVTNRHQAVIDEQTQPRRTCLVCDLKRKVMGDGWETITWTVFCDWIQGKRLVHDSGQNEHDDVQTLTFSDGSIAELRSEKTLGSPGYSEYTPGSDGHLKTPTVRVKKPSEDDFKLVPGAPRGS